jgi:hypothetical protein
MFQPLFLSISFVKDTAMEDSHVAEAVERSLVIKVCPE